MVVFGIFHWKLPVKEFRCRVNQLNDDSEPSAEGMVPEIQYITYLSVEYIVKVSQLVLIQTLYQHYWKCYLLPLNPLPWMLILVTELPSHDNPLHPSQRFDVVTPSTLHIHSS